MSWLDSLAAGTVLFDSESMGVAGMNSVGSDWTSAKFVSPTKVLEVTSIRLRLTSDAPHESRSEDAFAVNEVSMEPVVDAVFRFLMKRCLRGFHNRFFCTRVCDLASSWIPFIDPSISPRKVPSLVSTVSPPLDGNLPWKVPSLETFGGPGLHPSNSPSEGPGDSPRNLPSLFPLWIPPFVLALNLPPGLCQGSDHSWIQAFCPVLILSGNRSIH